VTLPVPLRITRQPDQDGDGATPAAAEFPAEQPDATPAPRPVVRLSGGQMSLKNQTAAVLTYALRVAWRRWRELARREGGPVNALLEAKAPSIREECDYAQSRAWVPRGHNGGVFEVLGVLHHFLIGRPGVALGVSFAALCHKPLRFWLLALTATIVVLLAWKG
jgi:hypothetical protein